MGIFLLNNSRNSVLGAQNTRQTSANNTKQLVIPTLGPYTWATSDHLSSFTVAIGRYANTSNAQKVFIHHWKITGTPQNGPLLNVLNRRIIKTYIFPTSNCFPPGLHQSVALYICLKALKHGTSSLPSTPLAPDNVHFCMICHATASLTRRK